MTDILLFKDGELVREKALDLMLGSEPAMFFLSEGIRENVVMENAGNYNPKLPIKMFIFVPKFGTYYVVPQDKTIGFRANLNNDVCPSLPADIFGDRRYEFKGHPMSLYRLLIENGFKLTPPDEFKRRYLKH